MRGTNPRQSASGFCLGLVARSAAPSFTIPVPGNHAKPTTDAIGSNPWEMVVSLNFVYASTGEAPVEKPLPQLEMTLVVHVVKDSCRTVSTLVLEVIDT